MYQDIKAEAIRNGTNIGSDRINATLGIAHSIADETGALLSLRYRNREFSPCYQKATVENSGSAIKTTIRYIGADEKGNRVVKVATSLGGKDVLVAAFQEVSLSGAWVTDRIEFDGRNLINPEDLTNPDNTDIVKLAQHFMAFREAVRAMP